MSDLSEDLNSLEGNGHQPGFRGGSHQLSPWTPPKEIGGGRGNPSKEPFPGGGGRISRKLGGVDRLSGGLSSERKATAGLRVSKIRWKDAKFPVRELGNPGSRKGAWKSWFP